MVEVEVEVEPKNGKWTMKKGKKAFNLSPSFFPSLLLTAWIVSVVGSAVAGSRPMPTGSCWSCDGICCCGGGGGAKVDGPPWGGGAAISLSLSCSPCFFASAAALDGAACRRR